MQSHPRYELFPDLLIGRNHYASVYEAYDRNTENDVVVLELHEKFQVDPGRWESIWTQVLDLRNAKLENTVTVFDAVKDQRWIVVEKMAGNFGDWMSPDDQGRPQKAASPEAVRAILRRILEALMAYEQQGVVHGDVKPRNFLFDDEKKVKLSFSPGLLMGGEIPTRQEDMRHQAPELLSQQFGEIGPGVDLYCLGFSALELLLGPKFDDAFKGVNTKVSGDQIWFQWHASPEHQVVSIGELQPKTPPDLIKVIDRLLMKPVADRYQSAAEALADLEESSARESSAIHEIIGKPSIPITEVTPIPPARPRPEEKTATPAAQKPRKPQRGTGGRKSFSQQLQGLREKSNEMLQDPRVLYTVCGGIILITALMFLPESRENAVRLVEIESSPGEAELRFDTTKKEFETPFEQNMPVGKHRITIRKPGYEDFETEIEIEGGDDKLSFNFDLVAAKPSKPASGGDTGTGQLTTAEPAGPELPKGLIAADGAETDPELKLPVRVIVERTKGLTLPLELQLVKPVQFQFGVAAGEYRHPGELSEQTVAPPSPFYMALTEVTNEQYQAFADEIGDALAGTAWQSQRDVLGDEAPHHPVVQVSVDGAIGFADWIAPGVGRLPSEIEWEFVAAGVQSAAFPWRTDQAPGESNCNVRPAPASGRQAATMSVDSLAAGKSPDGFAHLLGNVAEWCSDIYVAGEKEVASDPGVGRYHVIRGGSFTTLPTSALRNTLRSNWKPEGAPHIGFRPVVPLGDNSAEQSGASSATEGPSQPATDPKPDADSGEGSAELP